jgi:hypothetical protein
MRPNVARAFNTNGWGLNIPSKIENPSLPEAKAVPFKLGPAQCA